MNSYPLEHEQGFHVEKISPFPNEFRISSIRNRGYVLTTLAAYSHLLTVIRVVPLRLGITTRGELHWKVEFSISPATRYKLSTLSTCGEMTGFVPYGRDAIGVVPKGTSTRNGSL